MQQVADASQGKVPVLIAILVFLAVGCSRNPQAAPGDADLIDPQQVSQVGEPVRLDRNWIPNGWRITEMLADGTRRLVSGAKVSTYTINQSIGSEEFK